MKAYFTLKIGQILGKGLHIFFNFINITGINTLFWAHVRAIIVLIWPTLLPIKHKINKYKIGAFMCFINYNCRQIVLFTGILMLLALQLGLYLCILVAFMGILGAIVGFKWQFENILMSIL